MASEWKDLLDDLNWEFSTSQTNIKAAVRKIMDQYLPPGGAEAMKAQLDAAGHKPEAYLGILDAWSRDFRGEDKLASEWFDRFEGLRDKANQKTSFGDKLKPILGKIVLGFVTWAAPALGAAAAGGITYKQTGDWKKALVAGGITYGAARLAKAGAAKVGATGTAAGAAPAAGAGAAAGGAAAPFGEAASIGATAGGAAGAGAAGAGAAGAAAAPWYSTDWGKTLIKLGLGAVADKAFGGQTTEEKRLSEFSRAPFTSGTVQGFLPPALREEATGPLLGRGIAGIGDLIARPGGLSPTVSEAILPRLSAESESIAANFRNLGQQQAGMAARTNLPVSIKGALQSALDVAQERAQRGARREALTESEGLRRQDLGQTFNLLDAILQFTSSGRGQAIPGLGQAAQISGQRQASRQALFGNLFPTG